jgi:SnoaL-like domain
MIMRDVKEIFASIDAMSADAFVAHLTEDVSFRFGNAPAVHGRAEVADAVNGFWASIGGLTHHILKTWDADDTTICQIDVEYKRLDGGVVVTPNCDILVFEGDLVKDWQIYIDVAPVYAP